MAVAAEMGRSLKCLLLLFLIAYLAPADTYFLTVAGLGGTPEYESNFAKWASELQKELEKNGPSTHVTTLSGAATSREGVEQALTRLASEVKPEDSFGLFLIGHGTFDGTDYKFNLPGPDLTAAELAALLNHISAGRQLVVNMTSCSGASIPALAKKNRVLITATKSGTEKNATVFPRYWIDALRNPAADTDKNGSITTLEAFRYAAQKTAAYYEEEKLLATEHPMMTDASVGSAVRDPKPENGQGLLAARFAVVKPQSEVKAAVPGAQKLVAKKEELEAQIDRLKYAKAAMQPDDYKQQLSRLLLDLARTQAEIDR